jgi:hypothetical protein
LGGDEYPNWEELIFDLTEIIITYLSDFSDALSTLRNSIIQIPEPQYLGADPSGKGNHSPFVFAPQTGVILVSADFLGMISGLNFIFTASRNVTEGGPPESGKILPPAT